MELNQIQHLSRWSPNEFVHEKWTSTEEGGMFEQEDVKGQKRKEQHITWLSLCISDA